jgi:lysophospholipase L1-like esterase
MFDPDTPARSRLLSNYYRQVADELGCVFMDASEAASPCRADSIHMDEEGHSSLGKMLASRIKTIF